MEHWRRALRLAPARDRKVDWPWLARGAAGLHILALGLIMTLAWHEPALSGPGATGGGVSVLHMGLLMATGAAAALFALGARGEPQAPPADASTPTDTGVSQLLAQMSHELRTPLNAVIGFSEVMLRELHGPLGNARYQEYAAHISESGGRLLKSSEDTLAVTATMSALMADRQTQRRERIAAARLVEEAWGTANGGATGRAVELSASACEDCDMVCERRATSQALEHLLREAIARAGIGGLVEVWGSRQTGAARSIQIRVRSEAQALEPMTPGGVPAGNSLRVILARLLLEMQGATLSLWDAEGGLWSACIAFPPRVR